MSTNHRFDRRRIYTRVAGSYQPSDPRFCYYKPVSTGNWEICDCWLVDRHGRKDPAYNTHGLPVHFSCLGLS